MNAPALYSAVERFAQELVETSDAGLDRAWSWQSYDSEGVRFGLFRTYEDLRDLAARLHQLRSESSSPLSEAQRCLGQYHAAYRDLQAALLGIRPGQITQAPNAQDWPLARVLAHLTSADIFFSVVVRFALERLRAGGGDPVPIPDEAYGRLIGLDEPAYDALMKGPTAELLAYYDQHHARVLDWLSTISAGELDMPSLYWEDEPYSLRFRLHRFDSHLRQHTIQVDKTRVLLGLAPSETHRLLRLVYAGLAEAESALIGADDSFTGLDLIADTARAIQARAVELAAALGRI